jgi:shikimate dehydrogenase
MLDIPALRRLAAIDADVRVGLVGSGIGASLTPAMHEREGAAQGLRYVYRLIDLDGVPGGANSLPDILSQAIRSGLAGLNVTHPCKQTVMPLLDTLSEDARALGAVNTVVIRDGRTAGHNTDWYGFAEAFKRDLGDVPRATVVLLGAGGAGAAVAHAMLAVGTKTLCIADTDMQKAQDLAARLQRQRPGATATVAPPLAEAIATADGLINTTPVGMAKYPGLPLDAALLTPKLWVADIVYFPLETDLIETARALGCRTMGGGGMAVFQAVGAFELFSGRQPNPDRMQAHFAELTRGPS